MIFVLHYCQRKVGVAFQAESHIVDWFDPADEPDSTHQWSDWTSSSGGDRVQPRRVKGSFILEGQGKSLVFLGFFWRRKHRRSTTTKGSRAIGPTYVASQSCDSPLHCCAVLLSFFPLQDQGTASSLTMKGIAEQPSKAEAEGKLARAAAFSPFFFSLSSGELHTCRDHIRQYRKKPKFTIT